MNDFLRATRVRNISKETYLQTVLLRQGVKFVSVSGLSEASGWESGRIRLVRIGDFYTISPITSLECTWASKRVRAM